MSYCDRVPVLTYRVMTRRFSCIIALALLSAIGCENKRPPTPAPGNGSGQTITGRERIGWSQGASNLSELSTFRYAIYVDGARSEIADASCGTTSAAAGFACTGRLPAMSAGSHTLELAAFVLDGDVFESPRSAPLTVTVQASTAGDPSASSWASGPAGVTADGVALAVERLVDGLVDPVDASVAPDGRLFVAEREGTVRIVEAQADRIGVATGRLDVEGGQLLALALDPDYSRTRIVYTVYATSDGERSVYRLARFRDAGGAWGERAILVHDLAPATGTPAASLRAMEGGQLLLTLAGIGRATASSYAGKLLRFEHDGTAPRDQNGTPIVAAFTRPGAMGWDPARFAAWVVESSDQAETLRPVFFAPPEHPRAGADRQLAVRDIGSLAVYQGGLFPEFGGNVLVASDSARAILRLRVDDAGQLRGVRPERLLQDRAGGIRLIAIAPDGSIYFCTKESVGRVVR